MGLKPHKHLIEIINLRTRERIYMPYIKEICVAGSVVTIRRYHTLRYNCKGERRENRRSLQQKSRERLIQELQQES